MWSVGCALGNDSLRGLKTVELFVSGLTYDHTYFNLSYQPNGYSYVRGDKSGILHLQHGPPRGRPERPSAAAAKLTLQAHAYVTGQIRPEVAYRRYWRAHFHQRRRHRTPFGAAVLQYLAGTSTTPGTIPDYLVLGSFLMTTYAPGSRYSETPLSGPVGSGLRQRGVVHRLHHHDAEYPGHGVLPYTGSARTTDSADEAPSRPERWLSALSLLGLARNTAITQAIQVPVPSPSGSTDNLYCNEATGLTSCATSAAVKTRRGAELRGQGLPEHVRGGQHRSLGRAAHPGPRLVPTWLSNRLYDKYTVRAWSTRKGRQRLPRP